MAKNKRNVETEPVVIVETEPVEIDEKNIINPEEITSEDEVMEVEAPEVIITVALKIEVNFTDKYTGENYTKGKVVSFEKARAEELLNDSRKLVSKV